MEVCSTARARGVEGGCSAPPPPHAAPPHLLLALALNLARHVRQRRAPILFARAHKGLEVAARPRGEALGQQALALCAWGWVGEEGGGGEPGRGGGGVSREGKPSVSRRSRSARGVCVSVCGGGGGQGGGVGQEKGDKPSASPSTPNHPPTHPPAISSSLSGWGSSSLSATSAAMDSSLAPCALSVASFCAPPRGGVGGWVCVCGGGGMCV